MKIALIGYGKMGKAIEEAALERNIVSGQEKYEIIQKVDINNKQELTADKLCHADVAIEFSTPNAAFDNLSKCFDANVPVVSGTTGWMDQLEMIKNLCEAKGQGMVYASNFSIGVNIFFEINRKLAQLMNDHAHYDVSMKEIHHKEKIDQPSGTAVTLAEMLIKEIDRKEKWVGEQSSSSKDLVILSKREEDVPGIHNITYGSDVDNIVLRHTANSRKGFAKGALLAADWIIGKKGFYGMNDVLNIK